MLCDKTKHIAKTNIVAITAIVDLLQYFAPSALYALFYSRREIQSHVIMYLRRDSAFRKWLAEWDNATASTIFAMEAPWECAAAIHLFAIYLLYMLAVEYDNWERQIALMATMRHWTELVRLYTSNSELYCINEFDIIYLSNRRDYIMIVDFYLDDNEMELLYDILCDGSNENKYFFKDSFWEFYRACKNYYPSLNWPSHRETKCYDKQIRAHYNEEYKIKSRADKKEERCTNKYNNKRATNLPNKYINRHTNMPQTNASRQVRRQFYSGPRR